MSYWKIFLCFHCDNGIKKALFGFAV